MGKTGHLILVGDLLNFNDERGKAFEVIIQFGAILAVCWEFREKLLKVATVLFWCSNSRNKIGIYSWYITAVDVRFIFQLPFREPVQPL